MARKVKLVLQGKGGVGKSLLASQLAKQLSAGGLVTSDRGDIGSADSLLETILGEDLNFVIDNGASCFLPLTQYLA